jgi:hypothetical protein
MRRIITITIVTLVVAACQLSPEHNAAVEAWMQAYASNGFVILACIVTWALT